MAGSTFPIRSDRASGCGWITDHADEGEALTLAQWVRRAHDAGVSAEQIIDATWDGPEAEQARRLSRHIADQEMTRGNDTRATPVGREGGTGADQARPAAAGSGVAEPGQGFRLEADQPAARTEAARPVASQRGLFAERRTNERQSRQHRARARGDASFCGPKASLRTGRIRRSPRRAGGNFGGICA